MIKFKSIFCLLFFVVISAQQQNNFDIICTKTQIETSGKSLPLAFKIADSLFNSSNIPLNRAKSLLLKANLYEQADDLKSSLSSAEKAKAYILQTHNVDWDFRITGYLASQYRIAGLYEKAEQYLQQANEISKKIENHEDILKAKVLLNQEMALHEIHKKNPKKAIQNIEISLQSLKEIKSSNIPYINFVRATSFELLGECYLSMGDYNKSEDAFNKSKALLDSSSYLMGFVYNGLGNIYLKKNNYLKAEEFLQEAENIAHASEDSELRKQVYLNLGIYHDKVGDRKIASDYYKKHIEVSDSINVEIQKFVNDNYNKLDKSSYKSSKLSDMKSWVISFLLIICITIFIFFKIKHKKQHKRFTLIIEAAKNKELNVVADQVFANQSDIKKNSESPMSRETELKLLDLLDDFEKSNEFNDKNISLTTIAAKLNTNIRYLSYVINTHKKEEVKTYINRLRINYIVSKLTTDDKYKQYKISALAEECGFSSHSKFAAVFKTFTGLTPSVFISFLEKKDSNK